MKKLWILTVCLGVWHLCSFAQNELYNAGSLIHVENGALVYVEGEVNNASGNLENEGDIELLGNWTNTANYQSNASGEVIFSGTTSASISGNMTGANDFFHIQIDKTGTYANDRRVILNTDIDVDGVLTFTNGRIVTGINETFVTNPSPSAITGHSQAGSAIDDRYVEGYLKRDVTLPGADYDFPVGYDPASLGYQLIKVEFSNLTSTQTLTGYFQPASPTAPFTPECGPTYSCVLGSHGQWLLTPDQGSPTFDLNAVPRNFGTDCGVGTYTLMTGGQLLGDPCVVYSGILDPANGTVVPRTGLTTFAPVAVTGSGGLLPVELLSFEGHADGNVAVLNWITDHEINNDYFEIQRSEEGSQYLPIGQVKGQGTTDEITSYEFVDYEPLPEVSYYRLRQVDFDGAFSYSKMVEIHFEAPEGDVTIYPNPFRDKMEVLWPGIVDGEGTFELFNLHGQKVLIEDLTQTRSTISAGHLAEGVYYYQIFQLGQKVAQGKVIRE